MALLDDLLAWSQGRPSWQRAALRKLVRQSQLSDDDLADLTKIALATHDPSVIPPLATPLGAEDLPVRPEGAQPVVLTEIVNTRNINALAPGQRLPLAPSGITIIYGDNGTGKSGYVRMLKRLCRTRSAERILPNVFGEDPEEPQSATINYQAGDAPRTCEWSERVTAPAELSQVTVFDSEIAAVYVTKEQTIGYTPFGLDLLEKLSVTVDAVRGQIEAAQDADRLRMTEFPGELDGTTVGKWLQNLSERTLEEEVTHHTALSEDEARRSGQLETILAEADPANRAAELDTKAGRYRLLDGSLTGLSRLLGITAVLEFRDARTRAIDARRDHATVEAQLLDGSPIGATGSEVWRRLWEIALEFAVEAADEVGGAEPQVWARCPLCQQPLGDDAKLRMNHFAEYVVNRTKAEVAQAEAGFSGIAKRIADAPTSRDATNHRAALDDLAVASAPLSERVSDWLRTAGEVQARCKTVVLDDRDWPEIPALPDNFGHTAVLEAAERLEAQAEELRAAADPERVESLRAESRELRARRWASDHSGEIRAEIQRRSRTSRRARALRDASTNAITQEATRLTKQYLTEQLAERFEREIRALTGVPPQVRLTAAVGRRGSSRFEVSLREPRMDAAVDKVISEGEFRAVALAAFLAELSFEASRSGVVIDDPVSSLDLDNRERMARHLADLARVRQVVVFTHDVVFMVSLMDSAESENIPALAGMLVKTPLGAGVYSTDIPREAKAASKLIGGLRERCVEVRHLANDRDTTGYLRAVESLCNEFRKTLERCVEEVLLRGIVTRYSRPIRVSKVRQLAAIEPSDLKFIDERMTDYSAFEHDQPVASRATQPSLEKIEADIDNLEKWRKGIEDRVNQLRE